MALRLGCPVQRDILSATIVAPDAMTADAFATAFMVLGSEEAKATLEQSVSSEETFCFIRMKIKSHPKENKAIYEVL